MRILVAGSTGQLARAVLEEAQVRSNLVVSALEPPLLDLLRPDTVASAIEAARPDLVVNAAAYTAVDRAESDTRLAFAVNRDGAGVIAAAARAYGTPIIHVSTDYVFDGTKVGAYVEDDPAAPLGVYGRSKLEGEVAVAGANPRHVILRTAWLFSAHGHNFLKTMLRLARERPELRVVADQCGNPTSAHHLARTILGIAEQLRVGTDHPRPWGIFHAVGTGTTTWHDFAKTILSKAAPLGVPPIPVLPITTAEYPTPARRPANSSLDCGKLSRVFGLCLPPWQHGVEDCLARLTAEAAARVA